MYLLFALSAMIEGPLTILTSGAGIAQSLVRPGPIFLAVVAGNLVGDIGWYSLGRFAKPEWLYQISPKLGISAEKVAGCRISCGRTPKTYLPRGNSLPGRQSRP